ncbi:MAG: MopE-related protein [Myxococcota bacterium]|nr:MopE-related protein [Myxococcota bacterium]
MYRLHPLFIAAACLIGIAGCGSDSDNTVPGIMEIAGGAAATATCMPACSGNTSCVNGACQPNMANACTPACANGQTCVNGQCTTPPASGCVSSANCPQGEICNTVTRKCERDSSMPECTDNNQCMDGFCDMGRCVAGCRVKADCPDGAFCVNRVCRNDVQCTQDSDCGMNQRCTNLMCEMIPAECRDVDMDGFSEGPGCAQGMPIDCDDNDANVNPGIMEDGARNCGDGIDNNCDGEDTVCNANDDMDNDGFTIERGDCDDTDPAVNPNQSETPYDGKDNDCNPASSDCDVDGDGYGRQTPQGEMAIPCPDPTDPSGMRMLELTDCDDANPTIFPGARERANNGIDEDCDGADRMADNQDRDMDGTSELQGDCNDEDPNINPSATEIAYNGKDDDCDLNTPDDDLDGDGALNAEDCDDNDASVSPLNSEIYYNGKNDDCDPRTVDTDKDNDGVAGGPNGTDCNDEAASVNPNVEEVPYNGTDDDCSDETPDDDLDGDGLVRADDCNDTVANNDADGDGVTCETDCDDNNPEVNPNIEENATTRCSDGVDNDCRGGDVMCMQGAVDTDGDGIPDEQDCAPMDPNIPGPEEIPGDGLDNDCNPFTPDEVCPDDVFDSLGDNGTPATASAVNDADSFNIAYRNLTICPQDDDFYRVDAQAGDGIEVDLFFAHEEGDVDVILYRQDGDELIFIAGGTSITDNETVYLRRVDQAGTYLVHVYQNLFAAQPASYGMTINVFNGCIDDPGEPGAEQNDDIKSAVEFPMPGTVRQICEYDNDYYTFELQRRENVRLDLLFSDEDGDLDMEILDSNFNVVRTSASVNDDETIEDVLDRGRYYVRVYGFRGSTAPYRILRSAGQFGTARALAQLNALQIPDAIGENAGVQEISLTFPDAPAGSVVRNLIIRRLLITHTFLPHLRVSGWWDNEELAVFWNRQGDVNGGDNGEDDDVDDNVPGFDTDLDYGRNLLRTPQYRTYAEFAGQPTDGVFVLRVEDLAEGETGVIEGLEVDIDYVIP